MRTLLAFLCLFILISCEEQAPTSQKGTKELHRNAVVLDATYEEEEAEKAEQEEKEAQEEETSTDHY